MRLTIENFRGVERADIELDGLCLVVGGNADGKSSMAQGAAAALTGTTIPIAGLRRMDAGALVRAGHGAGSATIVEGAGISKITWPDAKAISEGSPPQSSLYGAGLKSISAIGNAGERAQALAPYLNADPTRNELAAELDGMKPDHLDMLWQSIEINGWDLAHGAAKDKGIELKGRWHQVTGENYGGKKAAGWMPNEWGADMEGASEQTLEDGLTQEREFLEAAIAAGAISDDKRRELEELAGRTSELAEAVVSADRAKQEITAGTVKVENELAALPPPITPALMRTQPCPHCSKPLVLVGKTIKAPDQDPIGKAEIDARAEAFDAKRSELDNLRHAEIKAADGWTAAQRNLDAATRAKAVLAEQPTQSAEPADAEKAREGTRRAQARLDAFRKKREADRIHDTVEHNQAVIDALAPVGLRAKKIRDATCAFAEQRLAPLCGWSGWAPVNLDEALMPTYGARAYALLSESERYRADVVMQVAMAIADESQALIIDRADILEPSERNGLFKMLLKAGIPALICMTMTDRGGPPDLAAAGKGRTYVIANGVAAQLDSQSRAA